MDDILQDVAAIRQIEAIPSILQVVTEATGMGFAAVARVTDSKWVACEVLDNIHFGLEPGGELPLETTICNEIRTLREEVVIDHVAEDPIYAAHHTPRDVRISELHIGPHHSPEWRDVWYLVCD